MKKRSATNGRKTKKDLVLREFETKDLGRDIAATGVWTVVRREKAKATSILLPPTLVAKLRAKGQVRGLAYQTFLKMIVLEHIDDY